MQSLHRRELSNTAVLQQGFNVLIAAPFWVDGQVATDAAAVLPTAGFAMSGDE